MTQPRILQTQPYFFKKLLSYHDIECWGNQQLRVKGFEHYNWLVDLNACFSTDPTGDIVDRTLTVKQPWLVHVLRPWSRPGPTGSFDLCMQQRVQQLCQAQQPVNVFYSGGIDSTAMLVGFLTHCANLSQLRVIYTPSSIKENPNFFFMLQDRPELELVDFSGDVYLEQNLDGIFVTADGADDFTASLDQSFFDKVGYDGLHQPWQDYIYQQTQNSDMVDWLEQVYFNNRGVEISTLLQARWFFYTACKMQKFPLNLVGLLQSQQPAPVAFFHSEMFEHWFANNTDKIVTSNDYTSYKQDLKTYIWEYDRNENYRKQKTKYNSSQLTSYRNKKIMLHNTQYIMLLSDHSQIRTPNLPFMSNKEYRHAYGHSLDYLFQV